MPANAERFSGARRWRQSLAAALLLLLACAVAAADPPGRVGRIAWLSGRVVLQPAGDTGQAEAVVNWPVTSGDVLSTDARSRAEVHVGSTVLQLDGDTVVDFVRIDDDEVSLQLITGQMILRAASGETAREFQISSAHGRFQPREAGRYRIGVGHAASVVTVDAGLLDFVASDLGLAIRAGQRAIFWSAGGTAYQLLAPENDDFAVWSGQRELQHRLPVQESYVSPEMTGSAELAAYGSWYRSDEYGPIWFPRGVPSDWTPYRSGRWAWIEPWGWTWVADEPWGFAPFHYGRWAFYRGVWGWVPGRWVARPAYAPALVAWVGSPVGYQGASLGRGPTVGWFPLAPREIYLPPYRSGPTHWQELNRSHSDSPARVADAMSRSPARIDDGRYANRVVPKAVTLVAADRLKHGAHIGSLVGTVGDGKTQDSLAVQTRPPFGEPVGRRVAKESGEFPGAVPMPHVPAAAIPAARARGDEPLPVTVSRPRPESAGGLAAPRPALPSLDAMRNPDSDGSGWTRRSRSWPPANSVQGTPGSEAGRGSPIVVGQQPRTDRPAVGMTGEAIAWPQRRAPDPVPAAPTPSLPFTARATPEKPGDARGPVHRTDSVGQGTAAPRAPTDMPSATAPRVVRFPAEAIDTGRAHRSEDASERRSSPVPSDQRAFARPDAQAPRLPAGEPRGHRIGGRDDQPARDHRKDRGEPSKAPAQQ